MTSSFYMAITDYEWFSLLREDYTNGAIGQYVNFWTPGTKEFKALEPGELFLFKLHNKKTTGEKGEVVGGAFFSHFERLNIVEAWEKYGRGNGRSSLQSMQDSLKGMRERNNLQNSIDIGCIILEDVFFLDRWLDEPVDWNKNIVSGKKYSTDEQIGAEIYQKILEYKNENNVYDIEYTKKLDSEIESLQMEGREKSALVKVRVNQGVFRERLLKKYNKCCLCGVENPVLLTASHIKPWSVSSASEKLDVENGFLLCPNHDALFDEGLISFTDDGSIIISERLSNTDRMFMNVVPTMKVSLSEANRKYLKYHRENVFQM